MTTEPFREYGAIKAHDHDWSRFVLDPNEEGRAYRQCYVPGCFVEEDSYRNGMGHTYVNWERANSLVPPEHEHLYGAWVKTGDNGESRYCALKGCPQRWEHRPIVEGKPYSISEFSGEVVGSGTEDDPFLGLFVDQPIDDAVNHPSHYTGFSNGAEVIDIIENLPLLQGTAIKYLARAGKKVGVDELQDLEKAEWYVQRAIANLKAKRGL